MGFTDRFSADRQKLTSLNGTGGHAGVEDGHVRSKVRLHRVTETERANREQTTEKNASKHMRKGGVS
jgi:hypothetical protein